MIAASSAPFSIDGVAHAAPKTFTEGMHRCRSPEETLLAIEGHLPEARITRLPDITGLDRVGIPVVLAVRPQGRWLAVDAGKGLTPLAATVSAAMEGIERDRAEHMRLPSFDATHQELEREGHHVPIERLPLSLGSVFHPALPEYWVWGYDLLAQRDVAVPEALVHYGDFDRPEPDHLRFQQSTNGLASGNHLLEAVCSGLYEVIERDAVTCWQVGAPDALWSRRVPTETIALTAAGELVDRLAKAGVRVAVFDATADTQVPVYVAYLFDEIDRSTANARGYGCHLDPEIALQRAVTEAAQARAVWIAGSRDDMLAREFTRKRRVAAAAAERLDHLAGTHRADTRQSAATSTLQGDLQTLLDRLKATDLYQVILVDLSRPDEAISVVKMIVPGLEGYLLPFYRPGLRAAGFDAKEH